jgi:hypoxanthine phosphoribosyltransferase
MNRQIIQVYGTAQISKRVNDLAAEIVATYREREFTVLGVLEDGFIFLADLLRAMNTPLHTTFLHFNHRHLGGMEDISFSTQMDITGRELLVVEGVLDTGVPQQYLLDQLKARGAASVRTCVLLNKSHRRRVDLEPTWSAFEAQEDYIFGYGLGFQDRFRQLPYLAKFAPE